MLDKIKYRLLFQDGIGSVEYDCVQQASIAARNLKSKKPCAVIQVNHYYDPPKYGIALYCCHFDNILEITEKAFNQFCQGVQ